MNTPHWPAELEQLLGALEAGDLKAEQRSRLNELLRDSDEALETFVSLSEVDAMLRWHHGTTTDRTSQRDTIEAPVLRQAWRWSRVASVAVAAVIIALLVEWMTPPSIRVEITPPRVTQQVALAPNWVAEHIGDARYELVEAGKVRLIQGELLVRSVGSAPGTLSIETPDGSARAHGTEFFIGTHQSTNTEMKRLTRVLVLSGTVTLTNSLGAATATERELLVVQQGESPQKIVARASNAFGVDLYRKLAQRDSGNMLFSPYSISVAMAMTLEGARGETADEIARALHIPESLRRFGDDAQRLPFALADIHTGHQQIAEMFRSSVKSPSQKRLRTQIEGVDTKLAALRSQRNAPDAKNVYFEAREIKELDRTKDELEAQLKSYQLTVANALFGEATYPFALPFQQTLAEAYGTGSVVECDFKGQPGAERRRINDWVSQQTRGRIADLLGSGAVSMDTRLLLVNAIYLKANWVEQFDPNQTRVAPFTLSNSNTIDVTLMYKDSMVKAGYAAFHADGSPFPTPAMKTRGQESGLYPGDGGFTVLEIPYQGRDLSMIIVLPGKPDGIPELEQKLTSGMLQQWIGTLKKRPVGVMLPKFRSESNLSVADAMKALGVSRAFKNARAQESAQFDAMTSSKDDAAQLHISAITHRAVIEVDEKGTEAAAATAAELSWPGAAWNPTVPFVPLVIADHPFLYAIRDINTGTILFLGRLMDPR